jgi:hypothetical protein
MRSCKSEAIEPALTRDDGRASARNRAKLSANFRNFQSLKETSLDFTPGPEHLSLCQLKDTIIDFAQSRILNPNLENGH